MNTPITETAPLRLLIPFDGSPQAQRTIDIALLFPPTLIQLLRVEPTDLMLLPNSALPETDEDTRELRAELNLVAEPLRTRGHTVTVTICHGDPAETIIAAATKADLVIMATRGRGAAGRMLFGSTADRVSRHATTPTLLIRDTVGTEIELPQRIVVPLDGSPRAERALTFASRFARAIAAPLHLVRAIDHDDVRETIRVSKRDGTQDAGETWDDALRLTQSRATTYLENVSTPIRATGVQVNTEVLQGAPGFVLVWNTTAEDLVVMTSHGRRGFRRWLLGSVAEKLIREGSAPTLLVPTRETPEQ